MSGNDAAAGGGRRHDHAAGRGLVLSGGAEIDAPTAAAMRGLYDRARHRIAPDGRPKGERGRGRRGLSAPGTPAVMAKGRLNAAFGVAKTAGLIYAERLRIAGFKEQVDHLVRRSTNVFGRFVRPEGRESLTGIWSGPSPVTSRQHGTSR